jgi:hypothetical protein
VDGPGVGGVMWSDFSGLSVKRKSINDKFVQEVLPNLKFILSIDHGF